MKKDGLVESHRHHNWMIYSLPKSVPSALKSHLKCLQDCFQSEPIFKKDLTALKKLQLDCEWIDDLLQASSKNAVRNRVSNGALTRAKI